MIVYPQRLHHRKPDWVSNHSIYHIRIRCERDGAKLLTDAQTSREILSSVAEYEEQGKWSCHLFLLMPDHLHALLGFGHDRGMSEVIRNWKRARKKFQNVLWQDNYFDHRIRSAASYSETFAYIERNPVALGLCKFPEEWPHKSSSLHPDSVPHF